MSNVIDLDEARQIKKRQKQLVKLEENITELKELEKTLHGIIISLTKFDKYSTVRRRIDDIFVVYQDIKRTAKSRAETLARLKNE